MSGKKTCLVHISLFKNLPYCFPMWRIPFYIYQYFSNAQRFHFRHFHQHWLLSDIFIIAVLASVECLSHCGLHLITWCWASFNVLIGYCISFLVKYLFKNLPILIFVFSLLSFKGSLYILQFHIWCASLQLGSWVPIKSLLGGRKLTIFVQPGSKLSER